MKARVQKAIDGRLAAVKRIAADPIVLRWPPGTGPTRSRSPLGSSRRDFGASWDSNGRYAAIRRSDFRPYGV